MTTSNETPSRMEPTLLTEAKAAVIDLVSDLSAASATLGNRLHPQSAAGLADAVRIMNCYYSNLIEGHNTTPREIEAALQGQLEEAENRRNLQLEAMAHIRLQEVIDRQYAAGALPEPASREFIRWLHREFYAAAPEAMLIIRATDRELRMVPGEFRSKPDEEVGVGRHLPPSPSAVEAFMLRFEERYALASMRSGSRILALPAAHHRLNFVHPFLDGNGRVSRLMSHAMALHAGIGAHGLWSISRGLARGLASRGEYKRMMDHADMPRQGDLDGRGNLSTWALTDFTIWFLKVCLDQVTFMEGLFALDRLGDRLGAYAKQQAWRPEAALLLERVLHQGEVARGEVGRIMGLKERTARELLATLLEHGILGSETPKGPVSLRFPFRSIEQLFPSLFPEA